ncbi:glycogen/starch synthase [Shewanella abyssi]|uniref:glycogen synthase n=1 Tax=Shewanella abyssi TaxID=311789 RepID=UPI00201012A8|nr:glycogen/starch synthase [Shewanella abyssi]MCL1048807.1 glycogen/starch synthase [Shewanella abyssi]
MANKQQAMPRILMLAAENGAIAGGKVGGMADVIRDLPLALAKLNVVVDVAMPSYGFLDRAANAQWLVDINVNFAGKHECVAVYKAPHPSLDNRYFYLFSHPLFNVDGQIYSQGDAARPFADDATKFALFSLSVAKALSDDLVAIAADKSSPVISPAPDVIHLHDWHCGIFSMLRVFDNHFQQLKTLPCVFSIHNLAMQGIRPMRDETSSLAAWFPALTDTLSEQQFAAITDPRYANCINPLRAAITLSDRVHLVSPSYAQEVLKPSVHAKGFFGGEGLEADLQAKLEQQNLIGILNGCMYPEVPLNGADIDDRQTATRALTLQSWQTILATAEAALLGWQVGKEHVSSQDFVAQSRLHQWQNNVEPLLTATHLAQQLAQAAHSVPDFIMTSVGRLTDQKVMILRYRFSDEADKVHWRGKTVLQVLLERLAVLKPNGKCVLLGCGDKSIAREFADIAARYDNFLFLDGYDEDLSKVLYQGGSLFLMPSSFEPCGISQMLAMREGQLCLVNHVGGLKDTVHHLETGFVFKGSDVFAQGAGLISTFEHAIELHNSDKWQEMERLAKQQRFDWHSQAAIYVEKFYRV